MRLVPTLSRSRPSALSVPAVTLLVLLGAMAVSVRRVEVVGHSMRPALEEGDRLVVLRSPRWWPLRPEALVALHDPRPGEERLLVKRVHRVGPGAVEVRGDNPAESTDSRTIGPVARQALVGVAVYRYAPASRAGWLRGAGQGWVPIAGTRRAPGAGG